MAPTATECNGAKTAEGNGTNAEWTLNVPLKEADPEVILHTFKASAVH